MNAPPPPFGAPTGATGIANELRLSDFADRIRQSAERRIAVQIHLSRLQSHNRREHHVRVAVDVFSDLIRQFDGEMFHLLNQDLIFVGRGTMAQAVDQAIVRLRYLFSEDPLTRFADDETGGGFCTWYMLPDDMRRFRGVVQKFREVADAHRLERARLRRLTERSLRDDRPALDPVLLPRLVEALNGADLSSLVRNQSICAITRHDPPEPVMEEIYVSIADLEKALAPDVCLTTSPWLFQYLTTVLDRRVLSLLVREEHSGERAISLNLNISTVLSKDFQRFDRDVGLGVRGRMVIEIQKVDIFQDMGAYRFAREYLHERGYKVCLDGMTYLTLPYIDRERLGLDLVKIYWSPELADSPRPGVLEDLRRSVAGCGIGRVMMCRCDSHDSLRIGRDLGISLYQGHLVDRLLASSQPQLGRRPRI